MTGFDSPIHADIYLPALKAGTARQLYQTLCVHMQGLEDRIFAADLYADLIAQETQTPPGIGDGVALMSLRVEGLTQPRTILARLAAPVDIESTDRRPVDIVLFHVSPNSDVSGSLFRISRLARLLKNKMIAERLRHAQSEENLKSQWILPQISSFAVQEKLKSA